MKSETETAGAPDSDVRERLQALLHEDLSDQELWERLRTLVSTPSASESMPTTDDATEHPGYQ